MAVRVPSFFGANAQVLVGIGPVAHRQVFLFAIQHQPDWRARLFGKCRRNHAGIACAELRAESTAHVFRNHADLRLGQFEKSNQLLAHAGRALGRGPDGQHVGLPVGDYAVRLERGVRLYLRNVVRLRRRHRHL